MSNIHWLDFNDAAEQMPEESFETRRERLRRALIGQLSSVLHHLFPSGKIRNGAFKIGGLDGQRGDSLNVTLRGDQAGLWRDFATGEGGDGPTKSDGRSLSKDQVVEVLLWCSGQSKRSSLS